MKRTLWITLVCAALLVVLSVSTFAAGPDTTPPTVWAFGVSATDVKTVGCEGNASVMVQAKASDLNGIRAVYLQYKRPGDLNWQTYVMTKKADGYWRAYIPKTRFKLDYVGTWTVKVNARDTYNNYTKSGPKYIEVSTCPGLDS